MVAAIIIAAAWHVTASGQGALTITFPDRIPAGPDFATDVLKDAWDFTNASDISPDPGETTNWTSFGVGGGVAGGHTATDDSTMGLLTGGYYHANNVGVNGVRFPIDTSKYKKLSFRMSASVPGNDPQIYWFHTSIGDPGDTFSNACGPNTCGVVVASKTIVGYKTFIVDMTMALGGTPWTTGVVRSLRLDPNNTPAPVFGPSGSNQDFFYDWVRLTAADNEPGAAMQNIQWSGGSGATTIDVYDGTNTTLILNVTTSASGTSYSWNSGVLPPGSYTFRIARTGASGTKAFTINTPPSVTVTDPSRTSGQDYATTVLGNAWDMSGPEDIVVLGNEGFTPDPPDFTGGILTATNTNSDPNITLLHNNNNALGTKAINSAKYRYLTYRMSIDGPVDVGNGSIARVLWGSGAVPDSFTTTRDILVFAGMQSYTLDLATLADAPAGGIDDAAPGGSTQSWVAANKTQFRFDPHEFGSNPLDPMPTRTFHIDDIKLTANPVAFGSYTIHFAAGDADAGDTVIVNLWRDIDRDPTNANSTLIAAGLTAASGSYLWNTAGNGVPDGTYYIYAEATDTFNLSGSYSDAPLVVSGPCNFSLAPTTGSVPNTGGASSFGITTGGSCDWNAVSNASFITITSSLVGTGNGTISYTVAANPKRTVRTGTLTAGGQIFTVTQLPAPGPFDFDGDGLADRTVYSPGSGVWSTQNGATRQFGLPGDIPVPGDYDGNGVPDTAIYRPSSGDWFVQGQGAFNWGRAGDVPIPADYNGDGITDAAVFRTTDGPGGAFFVRNQFVKAWGLRGDIPLAADFDGDHKADLAVFRPSAGQWFVTFSAFNYTTTATYQWGMAGDVPATGDFDGDGKADLLAYRPATGEWLIAFSGVAPAYSTNARYVWGIPGDLPLALDMDGDRVDELVIYRRSDATWWTFNRVTGAVDGTQYGATGDLAVFERPQFHAPPTADFDGDHRADITVFRPGTGEWFTRFSASGYSTTSLLQWGLNGDVKVPGDYDGDGKTDVAVYRPSDGVWYLRFSSTGYGTSLALQWGIAGDVPLPADYDGDGSTDLAIFRPSSGQWFLRLSANDYATFQVDQFGLSSDIPVPADYDGDGRADLAVYRPSTGQWYLKLSSGAFGGVIVKQFGLSSDVPMPSDWDGDGRADLAVYRPSTGQSFGTDALTTIRYNDRVWGVPGDVPVTQDFDGDGVMDSAVFHPSTGEWFVKLSSTPTGTISIQWGLSNDQPLYRVGG